jgi:hypothetical protein
MENFDALTKDIMHEMDGKKKEPLPRAGAKLQNLTFNVDK